MDLCEQSPSYIRAIAPYQPGKPIAELAREMGLNEKKIVKLASNENPSGIPPKAKAAIKRELAQLARYPDGNAFELKAALSRRYGVPQECIVVGNGSNDLLELVAGAFLAPGRAAVYSQHAFAVYPLATQARGAEGIVVPAKDYAHDLEAMLAAITPQTRLVFIANPNNPTGTFATGAELENFIANVPRDVAVVVDEAYSEYLPPNLRYDCVALLRKHPNFIVTRTFSKVYGLAGLRVGYGLMHPHVADLLNRVRQPFNVNSLGCARGQEIRREERQDEPHGHGAARARPEGARARVHPLVRQFPHLPRVAGEDGIREAAALGRHRQAAGELRHARSLAGHGRHAQREREVPQGAESRT